MPPSLHLHESRAWQKLRLAALLPRFDVESPGEVTAALAHGSAR
jgi:hypothetical protein